MSTISKEAVNQYRPGLPCPRISRMPGLLLYKPERDRKIYIKDNQSSPLEST